jgi:hypothetical protein
MPRIVPPTPEDQAQGSAAEVGDQEVTTNPMAAAEDKAADPMARAAAAMVNKAAIVAGTVAVAVAVDKEVDPLARAAVAVAMVNNSNTKVHKEAILDSLTLSWSTR